MKFRINPGELRHPIEIKREVLGKDKDNIPIKTFKSLIKTRAKILNIRGDEYYKSLGDNIKIEKTFYIRVPQSIKVISNDIVVYKATDYNIVYINNIEEAGRYLEIKCEVINNVNFN